MTQSEIRATIRRWESSGLSMRAFTESEGISYSTFRAWRRRVGRRESADLVPVDVLVDDEPRARADAIEIRTPDGFVARIPRDLEEDQLRVVLGVLVGC